MHETATAEAHRDLQEEGGKGGDSDNHHEDNVNQYIANLLHDKRKGTTHLEAATANLSCCYALPVIGLHPLTHRMIVSLQTFLGENSYLHRKPSLSVPHGKNVEI